MDSTLKQRSKPSQPAADQNVLPLSPGVSEAAYRQAATNVPLRVRGAAKRTVTPLASYKALPEYLKDNEFITKHYRKDYNLKDSVLSLFAWHNESGNIWTHLIGFLIFVVLTVLTVYAKPAPLAVGAERLAALEQRLLEYGKSGLHEVIELEHRMLEYGKSNLHSLYDLEERLVAFGRHNLAELLALEHRLVEYGRSNLVGLEGRAAAAVASTLDLEWPVKRWPVYVFTAGAMICLATSSVCHLLGCCALHITQMIWRFDYAGIAVLIVASFYPPVYYGFLCHPSVLSFYLLSSTVLGCLVVCVSLLTFFQGASFRPYRALLFASLGAWGVIPIIHAYIDVGHVPEMREALALDILMGLVYLFGGAIYALRVPERWYPGKFDLAFNSHQLFHVCVVIGAAIHYKAVCVMLDWRDAQGGCPLPAGKFLLLDS
ncbi:hypothetical protein WJX72_009994 [[Myrmecia] bisecta]|uniref:Uncharacterized protein n=1 Tax=[Myrmecia] bisecta TaxID=41462 RepID=A0AAW1QG06_9CHLO